VKTKTQLIFENNILQARLVESESKTPGILLAESVPEENNLAEAGNHKGKLYDALRASESRYRRLFETAQDGILILDAKSGKIEDANPFLEEMLGYRANELVGKALWEIGLFKDIASNQEMYKELKKNGYVRYDDLPLQTKMGEEKQVEFVSNIYSVDGRNVVQCNIRDISERKEEEAKAIITHAKLMTSNAELQWHDQELRSLYKINELLQSCNTQAEAFQVIHMLGSELFEGQNGCLAILNSSNSYLEVVVSWGRPNFMETNFLLSDCWALRRGQTHIVEDPQTGLMCNHFTKPVPNGYICVPMTVQGETLGLLCISWDSEKHIERQQQLVVIVGDAIKLSLSNLKLREKLLEQSLTDKLTGLGNRRYMEDNLSRELARTLRREVGVCVAMLDLDHFKEFNDKYGHNTGDVLLHRLGEILCTNLRQSDLKCRYGGEEFVVVLIDSPLAEVINRLEKIREMIKAIEIQQGEKRMGGVSVSIGLVEVHASDWSITRVLKAADEAMYAAKEAGRDRIVVYSKASLTSPSILTHT